MNFKLLCVAGTAVALSSAGAALSQDKYPSKPVRIIVALAPGAGADALARFLAAEPLRHELGTEAIVENRAGAGGVIGGDAVAKSKPDGYTLGLFHASVLTTSPVLMSNVPYNPINDFTPVANLVTNPLAIVVGAGSRFDSLEQLLAEAKKGKVTCGIVGAGTHTDINLALLKLASGVDLTRVPYSGGTGPILNDMMGGHLDCTSLVWPAVESFVRAGKFRALAVTSALKNFPQVPTFASKGYPQANLEVIFGIFGPAGLPQDVTGRLVPAFERIMKNPAYTEKLEGMGFRIHYLGPNDLAAYVKHELQVVSEVVKKTGISATQ
jgi:tripartite-type tricarboxylate transporter receptor subunit TctC